jgi:hypothetical protein
MISAFQAQPMVLTHNIAASDAKTVVKNNRFMPVAQLPG